VTLKVPARGVVAASAGYAITHKQIMTSSTNRSFLTFVSGDGRKDLLDSEKLDMKSQLPRGDRHPSRPIRTLTVESPFDCNTVPDVLL